MTITLVGTPDFEGPDDNGVTWVWLQLSAPPSPEWIEAFEAAGVDTDAASRPPQFGVEGDRVFFTFNASTDELDADEDLELFDFLEVVRRWIRRANEENPDG